MIPARAARRRPLTRAGTLCAMSLALACIPTSQRELRYVLDSAFDPQADIYPSLHDDIFGFRIRYTSVTNAEQFLKNVGFWIFPARSRPRAPIPVLLVHGHWSGPQAFEALIASLDPERFDPWIAYYPAGFDIRENARMLRLSLSRLCDQYRRDTVIVISFSMGGLIVRQALRPHDDSVDLPRIPLFIAVSAPWDGSVTVRQLSELSLGIESWDQFAAGAPFLNGLFSNPLPQETRFHIVYGVGGDDSRGLAGRDDGVLRERSMVRTAAVRQADSVTEIDGATHSSIIRDPETIATINRMLATDLRSPGDQNGISQR